MKNKDKQIPSKDRRILDKAYLEARQRVIKRGIVQFRADEEIMAMLLEVADHKRVPAGVLARSWIVEKLRKEFAAMKKQ
jgi:hypothetical protein